MPKPLITLIAIICAAALALSSFACQDAPTPAPEPPPTAAPPSEMASVTGTLTYLEDYDLPPDAVVNVRLEDVSFADAPSVLIAEQTITSPGQIPIQFAVSFDPARIDARRDYAMQATIMQGDTLLFINDTVYSVLTRQSPSDVDMVLIGVGP